MNSKIILTSLFAIILFASASAQAQAVRIKRHSAVVECADDSGTLNARIATYFDLADKNSYPVPKVSQPSISRTNAFNGTTEVDHFSVCVTIEIQ
jgi:hypothetical protein